MLLANGADLRAEDGQLRTPLLLACESSATLAAELLMDAGASLTATDKNEMTPLHWLARLGCTQALTLALRKGADLNACDQAMSPPLHHAIVKGELACAMLLLDAGADVTKLDAENRSALHLAMQRCGGPTESAATVPLLKRLLELKVDVSGVDREKRTALHWACTNNALPCVDVLLGASPKPDANARDFTGLAPIHCACAVDAADSVRALLAAGAHAEAADRDNRTPLHWAADRAAEECLKRVLEAGVRVDTTDYHGFSALHYAARRDAAGCVRALLERGADRALVAARGETAAEMTSDDELRRALHPAGLKRKRSLSSDSLRLEQEIPSLAEKVFAACQDGADPSQLQSLCDAALWPSVQAEVAKPPLLSKGGGRGGLSLGQIHACPRTLTACVELKASGADSLMLLTFNQDGLITGFKHYTHA